MFNKIVSYDVCKANSNIVKNSEKIYWKNFLIMNL